MKTRFTTLDICAVLSEINEKIIGMRLVNVYDIDHKTYLFKLARPDNKAMLLVESGMRIHLSEFDWPKNPMPSNFSVKLRKHLRGRRLVSATQLGIDRIVDLQFGSGDASYHVFVELYDRGNIALADCNDFILNLLRFRKDLTSNDKQENDDVKTAVHEAYPRTSARGVEPIITIERLQEILKSAKPESVVKRVLNPHLPYGASCIDHSISVAGFPVNAKLGKDFHWETDTAKLHEALKSADEILRSAMTHVGQGFIIQKLERKSDGELKTNVEFHPYLFDHHKDQPHKQFDSFNKAVDEFFSSLESQKTDMKLLQRERAAMRKLDNVRKDHESRLTGLRSEQENDQEKARLIESNLKMIDEAILVVRSAIANQVDWKEIRSLVHDAQIRGDKVASSIKSLKLETNSMVMSLSPPVEDWFGSSDEEEEVAPGSSVKVEVDLSMSAYSNAQRYYSRRRNAARKEQKTIDASAKAFKSAEKKTKQTLKEAAAIQSIQKARKVFWFEKFLWFISSENYLVIGGRDAQQNEIIVKRYLNQGDIYVHADLHGATSCVIKNPSGHPIPPKTLNEAGTMAICHSAAWDAKVVTSAWWVRREQVSKTAPSGEYLTTGSFLIRGKKNYLPPSYLVYGFGFLFKVDETCVWKHKGERRVRTTEDDASTIADNLPDDDIELDLDEVDELSNEHGGKVNQDGDYDKNIKINLDGSSEHPDGSSQHLDGSSQHLDGSSQHLDGSSQHLDGSSQHPDENDSDLEDAAYPDTVIKLQYDVNSKYQLDSIPQENTENEHYVYFGDGAPVPYSVAAGKAEKQTGKQRLSAKQRRELKKKHKPVDLEENQQNKENKTKPKPEVEAVQSQAPKRGQKKKLKKMKEKYKDQDEEDRELIMEILQSAKSPKPKKEKNKVEAKPKLKQAPKPKPAEPIILHAPSRDGDIIQEDSDEERHQVLKAEHLSVEPVYDIIDSLTGCPATDDILLFAVPVCAPYNAMLNFKFKVKLTPGGGKKGKATKTAINMFHLSKETTQQEKDHLRSVKDHDLSRNMPGKVKVSAPNIQNKKFKGKR